MLFVLLIMSLLFLGIGFLVTENNAKYLLAGYNTMSEAERKKVDIHAYMPYFRKFHLFLGLSFFILGALLNYFVGAKAAGIFMGVYPVAAYLYFVWSGSRFYTGKNAKKGSIIGMFVLTAALIFIVGMFTFGLKDNQLVLEKDSLEFKGNYGERLPIGDIRSVELVGQLSPITLRTNGFVLGTARKGYFKTADGEVIKLLLNGNTPPFLLITKADGGKIFYSSKKKSNEEIYRKLKERYTPMLFKSD